MARVSDAVDLNYAGYLMLGSLLALQVPRAVTPAHDELLFIVTHQTYELWFKVLAHELGTVRDAVLRRRVRRARHLLRRTHAIQRVLLEQLDVLDTMEPQDFLEFRGELGSASGLQSAQFAEIELLCGASRTPLWTDGYRLSDDVRARLERRAAEPSLWDAFVDLLDEVVPVRAGAPGTERVRSALLAVALDRDRYADAWDLAEALLTYDRLAGQWRHRHVQLVERMIGDRSGTGGSAGGRYLRRFSDLRYFPLLWQLPARLPRSAWP